MKIAAIAILAALLSACVSEKSTLTNNEGRQVHCDSWGFGIIGASVAAASHSNCIKKARADGYVEVPEKSED